jgi:hypothetical protein
MSSTPFVKFKQDLGDDKFALNTAGYGMTEAGIWLPIKVTDEGVQEVRLSGNIMEYYGATVAQRPEATEVPVGAAYMAVNTGDVWQSNGFEWVVL